MFLAEGLGSVTVSGGCGGGGAEALKRSSAEAVEHGVNVSAVYFTPSLNCLLSFIPHHSAACISSPLITSSSSLLAIRPPLPSPLPAPTTHPTPKSSLA